MTAPSALWMPFTNPVEIFPAGEGGVIDYAASYQAVCHQLTAEGMAVLQTRPEAPRRLVVGVHCEGRVFFLPGDRLDIGPLDRGVCEVHVRFTTRFDPQGPPPKIEFLSEAAIKPWLREMQDRRSPAAEKRRHERTVYNEPVELDGPAADHLAFALNRSEGGLALIATCPLTVGGVHALGLPDPDGTVTRRRTRVVRCVEILPHFYEIGGQFLAD